jgi:hypothetical protein
MAETTSVRESTQAGENAYKKLILELEIRTSARARGWLKISRPIIGCVGYDQTHSFISSRSSYLSYRSPLTCRRVISFVFHLTASAAFTGQCWWRSFMAPRLSWRKFCLRIRTVQRAIGSGWGYATECKALFLRQVTEGGRGNKRCTPLRRLIIQSDLV